MEQLWWNSGGETVMVEQKLQQSSCNATGGTVMVEQ